MKLAGPLLILALFLMIASPVLAQEEDVEGLRREVRQLRSIVKELTVQMVKLKARLRELEERVPAGGAEVGEGPDDEVTEEDWEEAAAGPGVTGTYLFDSVATQKGYVDWRLAEIDEEEREAAREEIVAEAAEELGQFDMEVTLHAGGKLTATANIFGEKSTAAGRWVREGDEVTLTVTHENGEEQEEPDIATCEVAMNMLLLRDNEMPFPFVLRKVKSVPDAGVAAPSRPEVADPGTTEAKPAVGAAGTYVLHKEKMLPHFEALMLEQLKESLEGLDEVERAARIAEAKKRAGGLLSNMNFEVQLTEDGTFTVTGENVDVLGTWVAEDGKITFTTLWEDGEEKEEPDVQSGRIVDGDIYFKPEPDMAIELILTRK